MRSQTELTPDEIARIMQRGREMTIPHFCHVEACMETIPDSEFLCKAHTAELTPKNRARVASVCNGENWRFTLWGMGRQRWEGRSVGNPFPTEGIQGNTHDRTILRLAGYPGGFWG